MLKGFEQRVRYKGLSFVVDVVDRGARNPQLVSATSLDGRQIAAEKIPYDDIILFDRLEEVLRDLMMELHERSRNLLLGGYYDSVIERCCTQESDGSLTPGDAVERIVLPFVEERFGVTVAEKISRDVLGVPVDTGRDADEAFLVLCGKILDYRIGNVAIFPMMFGGHTDTLLREWHEEFNAMTYSSVSHSRMKAVDAVQKYVLPELSNVIGKYMAFKLWDTVQRERVSFYEGIDESQAFRRLCEDMLQSMPGFYSPEEQAEKIASWQDQAYPRETDTPQKSSVSASDVVWKIAYPHLSDLLGKYMADKLLLDAIQETPSSGQEEYEKFINIISNILRNDLVVNLCDPHWIEKRRRDWMDSFTRHAMGSVPVRSEQPLP